MLKLSFILKNKNKIIENLQKRDFKYKLLINDILLLNNKIKKIKKKIDNISKIINKFSKNYIFFKKKIYKDIINIKKKKKKLNKKYKYYKKKIFKKNIIIPNIIDKIYFKNKKNNNKTIIYEYGKEKLKIKYNFIDHIELSKKFEIFNTKISSNISGTGFVIYSGLGLKLYKALLNYFLYFNNKNGYKEYILPYLIKKQSIYGTGQYPKNKNQIYNINKDKLYLIPTAEIPLINIYQNKLFNYNDLPIKAQSYTECFRREAGSYGKNVKGLNRLHQFGKVEIIEICDNISSNLRLKKMLNHIKKLLKSLDVYFRIILLPCNDISNTSSITYDFEIYCFGLKRWIEVSSLSNCTDYQSNNLNIRFIKKNKKYFCHTLNGSSLSIPRVLASIIELYQCKKKNRIVIPNILLPFYN
ncbi:MAG: serine--tRNA ligase [Candidatus Shikimatogenerans bostrichidophilus]|nr:MAG: serine--tRNA ligase [Candidatus Shikimatogenerans bostrichidophilus]